MRTILLITTLASLAAGRTNQLIEAAGPATTLTNNATTYASLGLLSNSTSIYTNQSSIATVIQFPWPTSGLLHGWCVNLSVAPGAGKSWTFSINKNGTKSVLSTTISASATSSCDMTHTVIVTQGDVVVVEVEESGTPTAAGPTWSLLFSPDIDGETVMFVTGSSGVTSAQWWAMVGVNLGTAETNQYIPMQFAGTLKKLCGSSSVQPTSTNAINFIMHKSGSPFSPSITSSVTSSTPALNGLYTACDNTHTGSVAVGDFITNSITITGSISSTTNSSAVIVPSVLGQFALFSGRDSITAGNATSYCSFIGRCSVAQSSEAAATVPTLGGVQWEAQSIYVHVTTAPGTGTQYVFTLDIGAAMPSSITTTLSGTNVDASGCLSGCTTTVAGTSLVPVTSGLVSVKVAGGTPAPGSLGQLSIAIGGYISPSGSLLPTF
jgi:hypothetical protein